MGDVRQPPGHEENGNGNVDALLRTGHGQPSDLQRSREAGFDAHLTKPTDLKALLRVIGM